MTTSASAALAAKNLAVFIAQIFSATAVAMNWLILVPSSMLIKARAAFNDTGSRNE